MRRAGSAAAPTPPRALAWPASQELCLRGMREVEALVDELDLQPGSVAHRVMMQARAVILERQHGTATAEDDA